MTKCADGQFNMSQRGCYDPWSYKETSEKFPKAAKNHHSRAPGQREEHDRETEDHDADQDTEAYDADQADGGYDTAASETASEGQSDGGSFDDRGSNGSLDSRRLR